MMSYTYINGVTTSPAMTIYAKSATVGREDRESLAEHTICDLQVADRLVKNLPFAEPKKRRIGNDLRLAIAVHDVGKAATGFQKSLEDDAPPWGRRHEILSAVFASVLGLKEEIIFAVLTHHKTLPSNGIDTEYGCLPDEQIPYPTPSYTPNHMYPVWNQMVEEWEKNRTELYEEWSKICVAIGREEFQLSRYSHLKLTGLSYNMGNNWIQRDNQVESIQFKQRYYASLLRGLLISADHIASSGSIMPVSIPVLRNYDITSNTTISQDLHGFQKRAGEKTGNLILRAPTGSGKTLAALLWATRNQKYNGRMFYVLPTTASINAMYLRLTEYFGGTDVYDDKIDNKRGNVVGLLHSRVASYIYSILDDDENSMEKLQSNQAAARLASSLAREMYYPIRVCTPHQILKYTLQGKGWELMLSEFPNSVFIFDEIHAYNPKLTGLTLATAKFLSRKDATCIFLSATLPRFLRKLISHEIRGIGYIQPLIRIKSDKDILNRKRHNLKPPIGGTILSYIDMIAREAEKAKSTLVVCNHVPTAQQVYRELVNKKVDNVVLLHSQFCRRDRNEIENKIVDRKKEDKPPNKLPKILVATQIIEVSLDIDFEQGFLEPAPIDALAQRLGRINRYGERDPANVWIFNRQQHTFEIYSEDLTDRSLKALSRLPNPLGEEDLNRAADHVYERGYDHEDDKEEYDEGLNYFRLKNFRENLIAGTDQDWVDEIIDEKEGSTDVLPEQLVDKYETLKKNKRTIEADDLLVPVGNWRIPYLIKEGSIIRSQDPWVLMNCSYSSKIGLEI